MDTEAHFSPDKRARRDSQPLLTDAAISLVEAELANLAAKDTPINTLRTQARLHALGKAHEPVGFFSLNLPTGLGKTLTSFRWALEHAKANSLERIIIVLPYTNIIDQTAERLKNILGQNAVLEHHASLNPAADTDERKHYNDLACENWDHPVIITTSVQFFETLFSNKRSKCRKLHNISNAVVILDEVQTLRKDLVLPTLDMLQDMQQFLHSSFVFCTATMPAFSKSPSFSGIEHITDLVDDADKFFTAVQRVSFSLLEGLHPIATARLEAALQAQELSTLVICNTKKLPRELHAAAGTWQGWDAMYHLSTSMCPHHRKRIIGEISVAIKDSARKILVFSTQLVEAGVDLDFPCVYRELAPLESIIQAAGRCNREGRMAKAGVVTLFCLDGAGFPDKSYETQAQHVHTLLTFRPDCLYEYATFHRYYRQVMSLYVKHPPITAMREQQDFANVADKYRLIDNNTQPVFVWNYNDDSKKLSETLRAKAQKRLPLSREEFRAMQQYSVQVYEAELRKSAGRWETVHGDIIVWNGGYDEDTGLRIAAQNADTLIF